MTRAFILIVDDEPDLIEIYGDWLTAAGYGNVLRASDGQEAFEICTAHAVDLLISDIHMPRIDGITLLHKLQESGKRIPVIIFASSLEALPAQELQSLGVQEFLSKPLKRQDYLATVEKVLRGQLEIESGNPNVAESDGLG